MSLNTTEEFWVWFDLKRGGQSIREIERRGGAPRGRISNIYRKGEPSAFVCDTIAKGLGVDTVEVFRRAGLLKQKPGQPMPILEPPIEEEVDLATIVREIWQALREGHLRSLTEEAELNALNRINRLEEKTLYELMELVRKLPLNEQIELLKYVEFRYSQYRKESGSENSDEDALPD